MLAGLAARLRRRPNPKLDSLARVPLLEGRTRAELERVAALTDAVAVPAGRELISEGAVGREFFVLAEGARPLNAARPRAHNRAVLRRDAKLDLLKRVPLFERCSKSELRRIAALADELALPEGRALTTEGERGQEFVVLVEGLAEVRRKGRRINVLSSGDFLGEIALVTDRPRTATVTTTTPARILLLTSRDFRALMREMPSIQEKVLAELAARVPVDD